MTDWNKKKYNLHLCSPWSGDCHMRGLRANILWRGNKFIQIAFTPNSKFYSGGKEVWLVISDFRR